MGANLLAVSELGCEVGCCYCVLGDVGVGQWVIVVSFAVLTVPLVSLGLVTARFADVACSHQCLCVGEGGQKKGIFHDKQIPEHAATESSCAPRGCLEENYTD